MNRRRWLIYSGGLVFCAAVLAVSNYWFSDAGPIRFENFEKIKVGMTQAEVVALIGCENGVYATVPVVYLKEPLPDGSLAWFDQPVHDKELIAGFAKTNEGESWFWIGDRGAVVVTFDRENKVTQKNMARGRRSRPSAWWQAIERRFGIDL